MSFTELYTGAGPLISGSSSDDPAACIFGVPFDSTHSYKPGTRFGPNAIRDAFNNIEVFHPKLGVDLEEVPVHDLGKHTAYSRCKIDARDGIKDDLRAGTKKCTRGDTLEGSIL